VQDSQFELSYRKIAEVGETPFDGDKFDRAKFGNSLSRYVKRMKFGAVLAIDAEWGCGKSWFGKNWKLQLEHDGHQVVYIDAFQEDYVEDPFVLIAAEIATLIEPSHKPNAFVRSAAAAARALAPLAVKTLFQAGSKLLTGSATLGEDVKKALEKAGESTGDTFAKIVEDRIGNFGVEKRALAEFRTQLQAFANLATSPLVVIIDELDRCRPDFAVSLLERIKHFFEVENVVFVLLVNKRQFGNAIRGVYGPDTDAKIYLEKFLNFTFTFPVQPRRHDLEDDFILAEFDKYSINVAGEGDFFKQWFRALAIMYELSPRQVQRAVAIFAAVSPIFHDGHIMAYLCVVKVCRSEDYELMAAGNMQAHERLLAEARAKNGKLVVHGEGENHMLNHVEGFHNLWVDMGNEKVRYMATTNATPAGLKRWLALLVANLNIPIS
jgi:hypothetical protein